jgi:DNA polymerase III epsilon subunit-like protein
MLIVLDLETTGLVPRGVSAVATAGEVVAIGAVAVQDGAEVSAFETLVRPVLELTPERRKSLAVSGIDPEDLAGAPDRDAAREQFLAWIAAVHGLAYAAEPERQPIADPPARPTIWLTSFGVKFDRSFLEGLGWSLTFFAQARMHARLGWGACIQEAASAVLWESGELERAYPEGHERAGEIHWCSLRRACEAFGIAYDPEQAHRALYDARRAAVVATRLQVTA